GWPVGVRAAGTRVPIPSSSIHRPAVVGLIGAGLSALPRAVSKPTPESALTEFTAIPWASTALVSRAAACAWAWNLMIAPLAVGRGRWTRYLRRFFSKRGGQR